MKSFCLRSGRFKGYTTRESHLKQLALQDENAWDRFYIKYQAMIHGIGRERNLSEDECEELMQDVAFICCRKLQDFIYDPAKCRFRTFLFKIAENCVFNIWRRKRKFSHAVLSGDYSAIPELDIQFMQEYEKFLLDRSFLILQCSVSSETFLAFDMLVRQELPVKEVISRTGMSAVALYTIKHRCIRKLRKIINGLRMELEIPSNIAPASELHTNAPVGEQLPPATMPGQ